MATFTTSWTNGTALHDSSSVANAGSAQDDVDLDSLGYYSIVAHIDLNASSGNPSGDVTIEVFYSADSGSSVDTEPAQSVAVNFTATAQKKQSLKIEGVPWARVKVSNAIGESVTYVGTYAGLKQTSA